MSRRRLSRKQRRRRRPIANRLRAGCVPRAMVLLLVFLIAAAPATGARAQSPGSGGPRPVATAADSTAPAQVGVAPPGAVVSVVPTTEAQTNAIPPVTSPSTGARQAVAVAGSVAPTGFQTALVLALLFGGTALLAASLWRYRMG